MAASSLLHPVATRGRRSLSAGRLGAERAGLAGVVVLAAALCLWDLTRNGMSNPYYAAAAKSASESWKALFFGSLDPGSFITVDKPPLSLWLDGLSARIFGFSSFSILLPQALCTIGAVALLFATVKRVTRDHWAGILAAGLLAVTPVTVAIARVNNPDALLVLLLVLSGYLVVRAIESGRTKHLVWAGVVVGLAFMTKMLQGWMVLPALGAAYLWAGPPALLTRVRQLALAGVAMVVASAAWPVAVTLWPGSTPFEGGSTDGTVWDLILGYNGLGRIFGEGGMGGGGPTFGGLPGWLRLLDDQVGGQIGWLLPLALMGLVAGLVATRSAPRTDPRRAGVVLFGVWAIVHVAIFSTQQGTFHPYYTSALAPAVAALGAIGVAVLAPKLTRSWAAVAGLGAGVFATAAVSVDLLGRSPDFAPYLRAIIPAAAGLTIALLMLVRLGSSRRLLAIAAVTGVVAVASGPLSYSVASVQRSLNGDNVLAGPASATAGGFGGMRGGMDGGSSTDTQLVAYLTEHQGSAKYLVAGSGARSTESIIIATGKPVVTIGGFGGSDPAPTVAQLEQLVKSGQLRYVLLGGMGGGPGGMGSSGELASWVQSHGTVVKDVSTTSGTLYRVSA